MDSDIVMTTFQTHGLCMSNSEVAMYKGIILSQNSSECGLLFESHPCLSITISKLIEEYGVHSYVADLKTVGGEGGTTQ